MNRRSTLIAVAAALAGLAAGLAGYHSLHPAPPAPVPDVALADLDGHTRHLSEWKGKLLLVNFWATWCGPCLHEIPMLIQLQHEYGARGLQIVGPAMDDPKAVREWLPRLGLDYPVLVGEAQVAGAMDQLGDELQALPFSVLIGPDGTVIEHHTGEYHANALRKLLDRELPHRGS